MSNPYKIDWNEYAALARQAVAEGCVLLKNDDNALPIRKGERVSVFGRIQFDYYKSGTGSGGAVNTRYVTNILDALKENKDISVNEELEQTYAEQLAKIRAERQEILKKAKQEAQRLIADANKQIENTIRTIREAQAEKELTRLARRELDDFRDAVEQADTAEKDAQVAREIERIERRRQRRIERKTQRGEAQAAAAAPEPPKPREVETGSKVRMAGQDMVGVVQSVKGKKAQVAFGQILTTVDRKLLTVVSNSEFREATRPQTARTVVSVDISARKLNFRDHIDMRGMRAAEALDAVQDFVDDALMVGVGSVSILHGKGTGALKEEIRRYLRTVPEVESAKDEHADRGGAGITIVTFKMD